jgi:HSP20 family protein
LIVIELKHKLEPTAKEITMAAQTEQKALQLRSNAPPALSNPLRSLFSPRRRSSFLDFGITPQEFFNSNPFSLMRRMTEEMDLAFQEFGMENRSGKGIAWSPVVEVTERDGRLQVRAELPGLSANDVKVEVVGDVLTIQGERKSEEEEKHGKVHRTEREYGYFYRSIPLPEGADLDHASSKFDNGMLEISIPEGKKNRRVIPIEGQSSSEQQSDKQAT